MPTYKFTYFNGKGAAESIRYLLSYGNIDFEDVRIDHANWPKVKHTTPFGQLPVFEKDGKIVNQITAISRYIAKQVKLAGKDDWENLEIDAIVDTINDLKNKILVVFSEKDEKKKEELREVIFKETMPFYMEKFEAIAKKNNGHLALGRLTWADFHFSGLDFDKFVPGMVMRSQYPKLQQVRDNVLNLPAVKEWIEKRPVTEM